MQHKKSLGQNFLKSKGAIAKMVEVSGMRKGEAVLEIGPGLGVLTEALLATGANVVAVEKDDRLIPVLQEKFKKEISSNQLTLIHDDILELEILNLKLKKYKVIANIPYYITGQIIRKFLEAENQPSSMTLLLQKEVAERIVAKDGKESLLSLSVKAYGGPKYVQTVKRGSFIPVPKVDSSIVHIANISRKNFDVVTTPKKFEQQFFALIHAGFAHKRKQLLPNLSALYSKDILRGTFEKLSIPLKTRAEDVVLQKWLDLSLYLTH
jgi:16S rRNA (adenine1518-N6/adenine1519-N6)-dimethyltransferase